MTYDIENPGPFIGQVQKCDRINPNLKFSVQCYYINRNLHMTVIRLYQVDTWKLLLAF